MSTTQTVATRLLTSPEATGALQSPTVRRAPVRTLLLAVCAVLAIAAGAPAGRVPPRPVEVSEVDDAPAGEIVVEPPQVGLTLEPATAGLVDLRVANGSDRHVSFRVEVLPVGAGPDGAPVVPAEDEPVPSAADWFEMPTLEVHVGPSEAASFRPSVTVPEGTEPGGYVAALRFSAQDGPQLVAFVLVDVPGSGDDSEDERDVSVSLRRVDRTSAVASATLDAGSRGAVAVTGNLRVRSWYGSTLIDTPIPLTIVLPTVPRVRRVGFRAPVLPGPYRVVAEDVGAPGLGFGEASARAWLWNPAAVIVLAVLLLLATVGLLYRTVRR